ncbi:MAG: patatin-like phospholipase family protein, partial [Pseudomonadota bacterium]
MRLGLALGGGGALGIGHIPVLEALDDLQIRPVAVAGTSMGAILGAAYAAGMSAAEIRAEALRLAARPFETLRRFSGSITPPGWTRPVALDPGMVIERLMADFVPDRFEDMPIPVTVIATDWYARQEIAFSSGPLRPAIAASIAIPLVFRPECRQGRVMVDGGLTNNVPFDHLGGADVRLAVDVASAPVEGSDALPGTIATAMGSIRVMMT